MLDLLEVGIKAGEEAGAQLVEGRFDDFYLLQIIKQNENFRTKSVQRVGIGFVSYFEGSPGYSFTSNFSKESCQKAAIESTKIAKVGSNISKQKRTIPERKILKVTGQAQKLQKHPKDVPLEVKKKLLNEGYIEVKGDRTDVASTMCLYGEFYGKKIFVDSNGTHIDWDMNVSDFRFLTTLKDQTGGLVNASDSYSGSLGFEVYESGEHQPINLGKNAHKWAVEKLDAKPAPSGKHRVLASHKIVGVLAHESFGHMSEADGVVVGGMSPLAGKIDTRLGSDQATIIDAGILEEFPSSLYFAYDDEGTPKGRTTVLDKGILKAYLHSRSTAGMMNMEPTGNARAIHYQHQPINRMTNTYFTAGDLSDEEALEQLKNGVYAIGTSGGQASLDGSFLFHAVRGYYVENGEIKDPIKAVALTGSIFEFLMNVEGKTKDVEVGSGYFGGCGKGGQFPLPTGMGGPKMIINNTTLGGTK